MNQSLKIWLPLIYAANALLAFLWLFFYSSRHAFHVAGVDFTSGILAVAVMLLADILIFMFFRIKSK